ncbi:YrbL family protein [Flexibacterium corallicola]|uniref:YrbL family protein n=1 Tax=Flexibacterium corallicola TaxID=3037259 RepID=UPI00286F9F3F|nr:YrbL family protein [Pseudovibrio sp. M1P-2-3]
MIILQDGNRLASGTKRDVYIHPHDNLKCIKVDRGVLARAESGTNHEAAFYSYMYSKRGKVDFKALSSYYGTVQTNMGVGTVFALIRDEDTQEPSKTLYHEMLRDHSEEEKAKHSRALKTFRRKLLRDGVLCRDLAYLNVCVQKKTNGDYQYFVIDGMGHPRYRGYSRLATFFTMLGKIRKKKMTSYRKLKSACLNYKVSQNRWKAWSPSQG